MVRHGDARQREHNTEIAITAAWRGDRGRKEEDMARAAFADDDEDDEVASMFEDDDGEDEGDEDLDDDDVDDEVREFYDEFDGARYAR